MKQDKNIPHNPLMIKDAWIGMNVIFTGDKWDWRQGKPGIIEQINAANFEVLVAYTSGHSRIKKQWNKISNLSKDKTHLRLIANTILKNYPSLGELLLAD